MTAHGDVWRPSASLRIAAIGAIVLAGGGIATARPELIALAVPLALWAILQRPRSTDPIEPLTIAVRSQAAQQQGRLREEIVVSGAGEIAELSITQAERRKTRVVVPVSSTILADSRPGHSGPVEAVRVIGRSAAGDGARIAGETVPVTARRTVTPAMRMLPRLPLAPRLTGLHGAHEGSRPGQGGDFRDIHPFAPGDELRRVDWRATARAARRPGELLVRRTHTLSDASVVLAVDTAEDLGEVVATWGGDDLSRAGTTSLDLAREAARSLAAAAIAVGDRVAYHALAPGGRSVRGATGSRHLARLTTAIAATGAAGDDRRYRRTPPVPHGSVIAVLSTFFDGAAAELALMWRAAGHRVIAVDTLPDLDRGRLSPQQSLALRIVLAEREDIFAGLAEAGVETLRWAADPAVALTALARARTGGRR